MSFLFKDKNGAELSISDSIKEPHKTAYIAISTPESAKLLASFEDMPRGVGHWVWNNSNGWVSAEETLKKLNLIWRKMGITFEMREI